MNDVTTLTGTFSRLSLALERLGRNLARLERAVGRANDRVEGAALAADEVAAEAEAVRAGLAAALAPAAGTGEAPTAPTPVKAPAVIESDDFAEAIRIRAANDPGAPPVLVPLGNGVAAEVTGLESGRLDGPTGRNGTAAPTPAKSRGTGGKRRGGAAD